MSLIDGLSPVFVAAFAEQAADYKSTLPAYTPQVIASDDLGSDISCVDDPDELWTEVGGRLAFTQALVRRLSTPHGGLFDDPNYGLDLRTYLHRGLTPSDVAAIPSDVSAELRKDERVASVEVSVASFEGDTYTLEVRVTPVDPALGELRFVVDVTTAAVLLTEVS